MTSKSKAKEPPKNRLFILGFLLLLVALVVSLLLSLKHIWAVHLPGCGEAAGCDSILRSPWAAIFGIPVAFLGSAYFSSLMVLWVSSRRSGVSVLLRILAQFGLLGSLALLFAMWQAGQLCLWCLAAHIANIGWWGIVTFGNRNTKKTHPSPVSNYQYITAALLFVVIVSLGMLFKQLEAMVATTNATVEGKASISNMEKSTPIASSTSRFGGRFWLGGEEKPVRIVLFQDYQCELCQQVEFQLRKLMSTRSDIALSVKQWPFDRECNANILMESLHPAACKASRAAEAIGQLAGDEAFWSMHNWLVDRGGNYTETEIVTEIKKFGIDQDRFLEMTRSAPIDMIIQEDIREGMALGLKFTPMLFVNGYEVKGWQSPEIIPAAIQKAADLAARSTRPLDQPELPIERLFQDWQKQTPLTFALWPDDAVWGDTTAPDTIMVFADITCPYNAAAEAMLEALLPSSGRYCYVFREFPLDPDCNDLVTQEINPQGCEASRLASAALLAYGSEGYWKIHRWIVAHRTTFRYTDLETAARETGLKASGLTAAINAPQVADHIKRCVGLAKAMNLNSSPTIYINGKLLTEWRTPGLLDRVFASLKTKLN